MKDKKMSAKLILKNYAIISHAVGVAPLLYVR